MKSKKIGISLRIVEASNYKEKRDALSHDWIKFLEPLDIIPILIPNNLKNVNLFLEEMKLEGVILSGGDNIGDDTLRDKTEEKIIQFSIKNKIPIFGVCRGMQVINQFFNGKIEKSTESNHVGKRHSIKISNKDFEFLKTSHDVNSFHNNIILQEGLGRNLEPFAIVDDGTIEGIFHKEYPIIGVMWHPERDQNSSNKEMLRKAFYEKNFWVE